MSRLDDGTIIGNRYIIDNYDSFFTSKSVSGYRIASSTLDGLVDAGVDYILIIDPYSGRWVADINDWLDYSVDEDKWQHLSRVYMDRG